MKFYNPVNVYIENNCVAGHAADIAAIGSRSLIVTGRHSSRANGSLDDVTTVLDTYKIPYMIFDDVEENPSTETVAKAAEIGKAFQADFVIGIGGGSPIDAAKAIALLVANPSETKDCLYEAKALKALPVIAVPTTCGTGTEATAISVLTNHAWQTKKSIPYKIFPKLSLVDGKYLLSASRSIITNTSVDALSHAIESYLHAAANPLTRTFPEKALKLWGEAIPSLTKEEALTLEEANRLMLISMLAGIAISQTSTSLPHAFSYDLTYNKGVAHGKACGYFQAAYMKVYAKYCPEDIKNILDLLGFADIDAFADFMKNFNGTLDLTDDEINNLADRLMENKEKLSTWPFDITRDDLIQIYKESCNN